ncbi:DinB family protein [Rubrivirga sp. S365]|uniref:DinB family protein n=1 Tax=Rubrivirga sp. S365 TaxID=3076080 RepID=UPI0028C8D60E|nr:DinB family protein [Rubrivirga sp. S365]MDT7857737.1 DinB family protein [Rubrivirga sp. S365]
MPAPPRSLASDDRLRHEVAALLQGRQAHVDARTALGGVPADRVGDRAGGEYSLWELLWHLRFTQADILEFVRSPGYRTKDWPADYWPDRPAPPHGSEWEATRQAFLADLDALVALAETGDLFAELDHAPGYTLLRELLLAADHAAYHLGQVVALRRRLGLWPPDEP